MISALETSTEFWRISKDESVEAAKAYGLFTHILTKVKNAQSIRAETTRATLGFGEQPESFLDTELRDSMPEFNGVRLIRRLQGMDG
jgi:hypothetical protein